MSEGNVQGGGYDEAVHGAQSVTAMSASRYIPRLFVSGGALESAK